MRDLTNTYWIDCDFDQYQYKVIGSYNDIGELAVLADSFLLNDRSIDYDKVWYVRYSDSVRPTWYYHDIITRDIEISEAAYNLISIK